MTLVECLRRRPVDLVPGGHGDDRGVIVGRVVGAEQVARVGQFALEIAGGVSPEKRDDGQGCQVGDATITFWLC